MMDLNKPKQSIIPDYLSALGGIVGAKKQKEATERRGKMEHAFYADGLQKTAFSHTACALMGCEVCKDALDVRLGVKPSARLERGLDQALEDFREEEGI